MMNKDENTKDFYDGVRDACRLILNRQTQEGLDAIDELQRQRPEAAEVSYLMGLAAITMDEYGKALVMIEEAHDQDPECYEYSEVLANLHVRVGNLNEGVYFAKLSTTLEPHPYVFDLIPADMTNFFVSLEQAAVPRHYIYGYVKLCKSEFEIAIREFNRHLALDPLSMEAHRDISAAYLAIGQYEHAIFHIQKALELAPDDSSCHFRAGQVSKRIGAHDPALYHFRKVLADEEDSLERAAASYALAQGLPNLDKAALAEMKAGLDRIVSDVAALPEEAQPISTRKDRIHVCYVVNNSWHYDVASHLEPILQTHDRNKFEVYLYQQNQGRSAFIQQLNNAADLERKLWEVDNEMASILVGGDEIDILVNMCSPELDSRATLFAMAPTAIQVGFHGANFGLGAPGITHVITDPSSEEAMRAQLGEGQSLITLLPGMWTMKPSYMLPDPTESPAEKNGFVTFGAHCVPEELTESTVKLFADVLRRTPNSRLLLGAAGNCDTYPGRRFKDLLNDAELASRVSVWPDEGVGEKWMPNPNYWRDIDIFLAPGPLTAPLRAADALWMGIPVISLTGTLPAECMATSILAAAAKMQWSHNDPDNWVSKATELAADSLALASLRASLRDDLRTSALFNPLAQVRALETLFTELVDAR
ncbi:tetratricopeptide repeat protein [bacterium SCSIO 12827]|nr:tetratricopeptide repeat protein [bacterium SCSIO 12827]